MSDNEESAEGAVEQTVEKKKYRSDLKRDKEEAEANEEMKLIKEFDFDGLPEHPTILIEGKRGSGKTFLLPHIVQHLHKKYKYDEAYLISQTARFNIKVEENPFFYIPDGNIIDHFNEEFVKGIIESTEAVKLSDNQKEKHLRTNKKVLFILDDCIDDKNAVKSPTLKRICTRGRHSNITLILLSQVLSSHGGFDTVIRCNVDLCVLFDIYDEGTRRMAGDAFLSKFNPNVGKMLMTKIPMLEPYMTTFVLFRNADTSFQPKRYSDYVYKYKAPDKEVKKFIIGNKKYIKNPSERMTVIGSNKPIYQTGTTRFNFKVTDDYQYYK